MTGEPEKNKRCPVCGGKLEPGTAIIPFILPTAVMLVKNVPAEICASCHEPYLTGRVTDKIVDLLAPLRALQAEVLIASYSEAGLAAVPA